MTTFAGTAALIRLTLRRDRVRLAVWFAALIALPLVAVESFDSLYPTQADLDAYARMASASPAGIALNGPGHGLHDLGGLIVFEVGGSVAIGIALASILLVGRGTRGEEEQGRLELLRSARVGRHAGLAATLLVVTGLHVLIGATVAVSLGVQGLSWPGSVAFGLSLTSIGVVFAAVTAVAAQLAEYARGAYAIAGAVFGLAYLARAAGDVSSAGDAGGSLGALTWFSPVGWAQATRPFADERWWPLLLVAGAAAVCTVAAVTLESRRDLGEGMVANRPGPRAATASLTTGIGLAWRLQRGNVTGWTVGVVVAAATLGATAESADDMLGGNPELQAMLGGAGAGEPTDVFFRMTVLLLAVAVAAYVVGAAGRARGEEQAGRAEPLLAGALDRRRWLLAQLTISAVAGAWLLAAGGAAAGAAYALMAGEPGHVASVAGAALAQLPAVWLLGGVTAALFGLLPRASAAAWGVLTAAAVASVLGPAFDLPGGVTALSPFEHMPELPGGDVAVAAPGALLAAGLALTAVGVLTFRRRDLTP
ncbi:hypothetical protein BJF85_07540 [Saccharomonospora sp. CUA-673]|uniref:ABC transporter permease n=1 Tax=Saccharomonospora sp. CUA-673 TaxID=1904969 RepID=UPI000961CD21|nr:hypothetical protein [Saccharomonospora sp. CUA-673]OLT39059.1 hypothetical protein BJF85_07540 [Saccharomonospora sp. CUA-673]